MSLHLDQVQANPQTFYSPLNGDTAYVLTTAIPVGVTNLVNPVGLSPGLYSIMVGNTANGLGISSTVYWNGTNWSAGGQAVNIAANLQIYSAAPYTQMTVNNTTVAVVVAPIYLVPIKTGLIPRMP
jgi:hypothetical protein